MKRESNVIIILQQNNNKCNNNNNDDSDNGGGGADCHNVGDFYDVDDSDFDEIITLIIIIQIYDGDNNGDNNGKNNIIKHNNCSYNSSN